MSALRHLKWLVFVSVLAGYDAHAVIGALVDNKPAWALALGACTVLMALGVVIYYRAVRDYIRTDVRTAAERFVKSAKRLAELFTDSEPKP